jgi:hypothetical protein
MFSMVEMVNVTEVVKNYMEMCNKGRGTGNN